MSIALYIYISIKKEINNPCKVGPDTVYQVGKNCRYAILSGRNSITNIYEWSLFDRKTSPISIRDDIIAYYDKNDYLYLLTNDTYIKIDYIKEKIYYYTSDMIENNDKEIFENLKNKKIGYYKKEK